MRRHPTARSLRCVGLLLACSTILPGQESTPLERLKSEQATVRIEALAELAKGQAGRPEQEAVAAALCDPVGDVRGAAVTALLALRPDLAPAAELLRDIVADETETAWESAVGLGGRMLRPNVDRHLAGLDHADAAERAKAIQKICQAGSAARGHQERLLTLANDPAVEVRLALVRHLHQIDWNEAIRATLIAALKDQEPTVRAQAARSLGIGHDEAEVVAALRTVVQDPEPTVRANAIEGIGRCRQHGDTAAVDVLASLRDRASAVRIAALTAAANLRLTDERAIAAIGRCLEDAEPAVLTAALQAVARAGAAAQSTWPRVLQLTRHGSDEVRADAVFAIGLVAPDERRGATALRLVESLLDPSKLVQPRAFEALTRGMRR
ncbi:MAG: HEAT repeat domain-containing protein [Planctomycetes bacterium]|nr:HEAT repeat domain-containing protein [Planctomycetota bacterium]